VTQPNGTSIITTYNAQGEPAAVEATVGTVNPVKEIIAYDALGNVTSSTVTTSTATPVASTAAEYDARGNVTSLADRKGVEMTFDYDDEDNPAGVSDSVGGSSRAVGYAYDDNSALTTIQFGDATLTVFGFDEARRRMSQSSLSGSLVTVMAYDATSKITSMTTSYSSTQLAHYEYGYDQGARITSATEGTATTNYAYDDLSRLTLVTNPDSSTVAYAYDDLGNRLSKKRSGEASTTYEYDAANQLTSEARLATGETITYTYDDNGNLVLENSTFDGITTYSYDAKNRLAKVVKPSGDSVEFVYDGNDNRYEKRSIPASGTATSTFYAYDAEGNIALEYDTNNIVKVRYIRDSGTGRALAMEQAGAIYHFVYNEHGDVRKVVDSNGQVVATYSHDEFGNETSSTGTLYNPLRCSGANNAYFDSETGLYKMGARYYKPAIGRWITRDSISGASQAPVSQHKYIYAEDDPVNKTDETGHWAASDHQRATRMCAVDVGVRRGWAKTIGKGSRRADSPPYAMDGGYSRDHKHFYVGEATRRHFDYARGSGKKNDSRYQMYRAIMKLAIREFKRHKRTRALRHLGLALHSFPQDYYAHGYIRKRQHGHWKPPIQGTRPESTQRTFSRPDWPGWPGAANYWCSDESTKWVVDKPGWWGDENVGGPDGWPGGTGPWRRYTNAFTKDTVWCIRYFIGKT